MSELTFIGTGEATDPDLPNTSLLYRGARTVLLDCGTSVPPAL
jgi:ribonuclease BN (tRNA processing enzyme)